MLWCWGVTRFGIPKRRISVMIQFIYFGEPFGDSVRKIAYAASLEAVKCFRPSVKTGTLFRVALDWISVRELDAVKLVRDVANRDALQVVDPGFFGCTATFPHVDMPGLHTPVCSRLSP